MKLNDLLLRNGLQLVNIPKFRGCIKFINGTSIEICTPWNNDIHWSWFNKHKKMYHMNNTMMDYSFTWMVGILISSMMWTSNESHTYIKTKVNCFVHVNKYFEYLLGTRHVQVKGCSWWRLGRHKLALDHNLDVVQAYNKMHGEHRM